MTGTLVRKLLRDVRLPLFVVALLLLGFECLWAKITQRIVEEVLPLVLQKFSLKDIMQIVFQGPGKLVQAIIGGESIDFMKSYDVLTIGYVHPVVQALLCIWAVGRASSAISGEIDRGTMELLMAQPIRRSRVVLAHLGVDLLVIPLLCLSLWAGNWLGIGCFGEITPGEPPTVTTLKLDPRILLPALSNVALLLFAVSGYTLWFSARGRSRGRVLGAAVLFTLLQFLVNALGQLWDKIEVLRPFTVFFYYQPQQILLQHRWTVDLGQAWHLERPLIVNVLVVLGLIGVTGYTLALWSFCRRDLPAPL
jgi:ABC-2 type transport system permease protein